MQRCIPLSFFSYSWIIHSRVLFCKTYFLLLHCWIKSFFKYINIYSISSRPSIIITQAARMCSDACVCPPDESLHYRLALLQRNRFKGTCLNNLTLLQTSGWWRSAWSLRNHFALHASKIIIYSCCISYQIFTLYSLQHQNTFTTKLICYGRDKIFPSYLYVLLQPVCSNASSLSLSHTSI